MTIDADDVDVTVDLDVRRRAGWLPQDHDELESWLAGHRKRAEAKREQVELPGNAAAPTVLVRSKLAVADTAG